MAYTFSHLKQKAKDVLGWLVKENAQIRTGRASPAILDAIEVESYGVRVPIAQVGAISVEDPRTLRVTPWDTSQVKEIEKAIVSSNLGLSVAVDEKGVRVSFPALTTERREALVRLAKNKLEEAKVSLRKVRDEVWNDIQDKEKKKELTEDDKFRLKTEMQKIVDESGKLLEDLKDKKEKEILS